MFLLYGMYLTYTIISIKLLQNNPVFTTNKKQDLHKLHFAI